MVQITFFNQSSGRGRGWAVQGNVETWDFGEYNSIFGYLLNLIFNI